MPFEPRSLRAGDVRIRRPAIAYPLGRLDQWRELYSADARTGELADAAHFLVDDRPDAVMEAIADFV